MLYETETENKPPAMWASRLEQWFLMFTFMVRREKVSIINLLLNLDYWLLSLSCPWNSWMSYCSWYFMAYVVLWCDCLFSVVDAHCFRWQALPTELWLRLLNARLQLYDCVKKGWVMDGFPQTRDQALALQAKGISPKHCGGYSVVLGDRLDFTCRCSYRKFVNKLRTFPIMSRKCKPDRKIKY